MPKFLIEGEIQGPGKLSPQELRTISQAEGFPANRVSRIGTVIDPTTAE